MGKKVKRYFDLSKENETEATTTSEKSTSDVILFDNTNIKEKPWGRRREDRYLKKKNQNNRITKKYNPKKPFQKKTEKLITNNNKFKRKEIKKELLEKYSKGEGVNLKKVHTKVHRKKIEHKEKNIQFATEFAARTEILLTEQSGFLEADSGETTTQFTQKQIAESVDITSAAKQFELKLEFGPYRAKYTRNGRHLLLGGEKGHVAAFDWVTKRLHCEMNVMEHVYDVNYLHLETMFAVAQKNWVYFYDNEGIELHCVKQLHRVTRLEFLPYHFLLAGCTDQGYLKWLDVSIGEIISEFNTRLGRLSIMCQNPWNACLCLGHAKGVVSLWSPNVREPLAKLFCHKAPITAVHVDPSGTYMATAGTNKELKIWDIRNLQGPLQDYRLFSAASNLAFSQKKLLAVGRGNIVEVYRNCCTTAERKPYLRHRFNNTVDNFNFCPFEDILGVATERGFTSLLIPGSGEANLDTYECNPFQAKSQRKEAEVKALLEKIQPELICLNPAIVAEVDVPTLRDKIEAQKQLLHLKPPKIDYQPRNKSRGKGGSVRMAQSKKIIREEARKDFKNLTKDLIPRVENTGPKVKKPYNVLDRFKKKKITNNKKK